MKKILAIVIVLLLTPLTTLAQDFCEGLADYDKDVDGADAFMFKSHFGRSVFKNPCPPDGPAPVSKTGQVLCYDWEGLQIDCVGTGQDGELQKGAEWLNPRFTDNGDGTITDNLTGLIWLQNANCLGIRNWNNALSDCNGLANGQCGLNDGSVEGAWRLPNRKELFSLTHDGYINPAISNTAGTGQWSEGDPFNNVEIYSYWSSATLTDLADMGWWVYMGDGSVDFSRKNFLHYVWCVRGGH